MRGVFANRLWTAETPTLAAQGQSVSWKTVAEVPLTGLSFITGGQAPITGRLCAPTDTVGSHLTEATLAAILAQK